MFRVIVLPHHVLSSRPTIRRESQTIPLLFSCFFCRPPQTQACSPPQVIYCWCLRWKTLRLNLGSWFQNQDYELKEAEQLHRSAETVGKMWLCWLRYFNFSSTVCEEVENNILQTSSLSIHTDSWRRFLAFGVVKPPPCGTLWEWRSSWGRVKVFLARRADRNCECKLILMFCKVQASRSYQEHYSCMCEYRFVRVCVSFSMISCSSFTGVYYYQQISVRIGLKHQERFRSQIQIV